MKEITPETLHEFFNRTPSIRKLEKEAGMAQGSLAKMVKGKKLLTEQTKARLKPLLEKYNF
jgi:hypothetical protein